MNGWDLVLLIVVGYVATMALVRLMIRRRDQLVNEFRQRMKRGKGRKEADQEEQQLPTKRSRAA